MRPVSSVQVSSAQVSSAHAPIVHVIGAGLAGLAAAIRLNKSGFAVQVYESAGQAGGRCRSFHDRTLGCLIDNGNHLLLSGNRSALAYLDEIGARGSLIAPKHAVFPFVDLESGARWTLRPNAGPVPWWLLRPARRVPGTRLTDYRQGLRLFTARPDQTVADVLHTAGPLYTRFWEPLTLAALNCDAEYGAARLLRAVLKETFAKGESACRPLIARDGLGPSFIDPAVNRLAASGRPVRFTARLRGIAAEGERVTALHFGDHSVDVGPTDVVLCALPPARVGQVLPWITPPGDGEVIVNAHFRFAAAPPLKDAPFLGLINAMTHWIFVRGPIISLTISAGGPAASMPEEDLLPLLWREVTAAFGLGDRPYEAASLIREKRATDDHSPEGVARRRPAVTPLRNLFLAGDWTDTGLPATIESAVRSGHTAARLIARRLNAKA